MMSYQIEIGCASAITNYEFRNMLVKNATSWLALPFWGGMGEAPMFISEKVSAVRLVIERC